MNHLELVNLEKIEKDLNAYADHLKKENLLKPDKVEIISNIRRAIKEMRDISQLQTLMIETEKEFQRIERINQRVLSHANDDATRTKLLATLQDTQGLSRDLDKFRTEYNGLKESINKFAEQIPEYKKDLSSRSSKGFSITFWNTIKKFLKLIGKNETTLGVKGETLSESIFSQFGHLHKENDSPQRKVANDKEIESPKTGSLKK